MSQRYKRVKPAATNLLKRMAASHIINMVCIEYKVQPKAALSTSMKPEMLEARQSTIYMLRELGLNVREISQYTGVPFSSISRHLKRVTDIMSVDKDYKAKIQMLHYSLIQIQSDSPTLYNKNENINGQTEEIC